MNFTATCHPQAPCARQSVIAQWHADSAAGNFRSRQRPSTAERTSDLHAPTRALTASLLLVHGRIDAHFRGQSCIRELDGILPHFGLEKSSDASLVDGTSLAVSASATSLAYSPEGRRSHELQYDRIEDPSVAPMLGGLVQDGDAAHMPHRMLEGSGASMSPGADPSAHSTSFTSSFILLTSSQPAQPLLSR